MLNIGYLSRGPYMKYSFENYLENRDANLAESLFGKAVGLAKAGAQGLASAGIEGIKGFGKAAYDAAKTGLKSAQQSYANRDLDRAIELMGTADDPYLKKVLQDYIKNQSAEKSPTAATTPAATTPAATTPAATAEPAVSPTAETTPPPDSFIARCPSCNIKLKVKKSLVGKKLNCPKCKKLLKSTDQGTLESF